MISCVAAALEQAPGGSGQGQGRYGSVAAMYRFKKRQMPLTARACMTSRLFVCLCVFSISTRSYPQVLDKATLMCCGDGGSAVREVRVFGARVHKCSLRSYSFSSLRGVMSSTVCACESMCLSSYFNRGGDRSAVIAEQRQMRAKKRNGHEWRPPPSPA